MLVRASLSDGDFENIASFYGLTHRFAHAYIGSVTHFVRTLLKNIHYDMVESDRLWLLFQMETSKTLPL
ncbi:hypothetical protein PRIP_16532, partial [Listeria riparia FSL S10-1204]